MRSRRRIAVRMTGVAVVALTATSRLASADGTAVLTPHVQETVDAAAREAARRIGEAIRRRLASAEQAGEARTLLVIAEALRCDARTRACLAEIAAQLGADRLIAGELDWRGRRLVLQDLRRDGAARTVEAGVSDDVLEGPIFDAWIDHVLRRLGGKREGTVVLHRTGSRTGGAEVRVGERVMDFELPSFVGAGRYPVFLERNGERLTLGALEVRDGRRHERHVNFQEVRMGGPRGSSDEMADFEDDPIYEETRVLATASRGMDAALATTAGIRGELELQAFRFVSSVQAELSLATGEINGAEHTGLSWSARSLYGVGTWPGSAVAASLVVGVGGSGITGLVAPAFEVPVRARLAFDAPLRPALQLSASFTLDDDRADGTSVPFAGDLEASVELAMWSPGKGGSSRGLVVRLGYRELADQQLVGLSLGYGMSEPLGERRRPTLTEEPDPLESHRRRW